MVSAGRCAATTRAVRSGSGDRAERIESGSAADTVEFLFGEIYAPKNDQENAFEHLKIAVDNGYNQPEQFDKVKHLDSLRSDTRFAQLKQQAQRNLKPCADTPENRQFDFWIGEWNVETTQGSEPAGESENE